MRRGKRTLAIVVLTTTLVSCGGEPAPATTPTTAFETLHVYATDATFPLVAELTTAYNNVQPHVGFDTLQASYSVLVEMLLGGETAYFVSNHLPADSTLWAAPIGQDGIAIIAHAEVDIEGLTLRQIRDIYRGRRTQWPNSTRAITVFSREAGSGMRAEFDRMVMGRRETTPNARIAFSNERMITSVAEQPGSIGYVSTGFLLDERVRTLAVDDILPTSLNIQQNLYPLRSTLYVVGMAESRGTYRRFIGWIQSETGQMVVARNYTPLNALIASES